MKKPEAKVLKNDLKSVPLSTIMLMNLSCSDESLFWLLNASCDAR